MKALTERQAEVLDYIRNFTSNNGYSPTYNEIGLHFRITTPAARDHVLALQKKNKILLSNNCSRTINIIGEKVVDSDNIDIPILGRVAAGVPIMSEENYNGSISMPASRLGKGNFFALRINGLSMKDAGILDNDIAIIRQQKIANNGEIVVAMVEDYSYTIKRFFKEKNRIRLKPENPDFPSIYYKHVDILGKLKCIVRDYD